MTKINTETRAIVVGLRMANLSWKDIVSKTNVSQSSAQRIWNKWTKHLSVKDLPRSGRPKVTTFREDRRIKRVSETNRKLTAAEVTASINFQRNVSVSTVKRRLCSFGLNGRIARKKPYMTKEHQRKRYLWAKERRNWTIADWLHCVYTDECRISKSGSCNHREWVRRRVGEDCKEECISATRFREQSLMLWGCISLEGVGPLKRFAPNERMSAKQYKQLLIHRGIPYLLTLGKQHNTPFMFQHDGASSHTAKTVKTYLQRKNIDLLPWPAHSPDLNPIENVWSKLKRNVSRRMRTTSLDDLWQNVQEEWLKIDKNYILSLIQSMPRRIKAVLKSKGGATKY